MQYSSGRVSIIFGSGIWTTIGLSDIPDYAVSSLAQLLCYIISFVNDEVLVEDFEDLAALEVSHLVSVHLIIWCGKRNE